MKWLLNDKGMMFGNRINIIDFLVIVFILSLTPCFYFGWKIYNKPQPQLQPKITIEIPIKEYGELKNKIRDYELLLDTLTNQQDLAGKERDILQDKINDYLKEHKHARKYFK